MWWEPVPSRGKVLGYIVYYAMSPSPDLVRWKNVSLPVTHSAELQNMERHAEYAIRIAAITSQVRSTYCIIMVLYLY